VLGLTPGEREAVYEAVVALMRARLEEGAVGVGAGPRACPVLGQPQGVAYVVRIVVGIGQPQGVAPTVNFGTMIVGSRHAL